MENQQTRIEELTTEAKILLQQRAMGDISAQEFSKEFMYLSRELEKYGKDIYEVTE